MTVAYDEAIATLKAMFENTDDQMIKTVLEANGGHMEHTVNDLLAMAEAGSEHQDTTSPQPPQAQTAEERARAFLAPREGGAGGLPTGFLQVDASSSSAPDTTMAYDNLTADQRTRMVSDEALAQALQSEEYRTHGAAAMQPPGIRTLHEGGHTDAAPNEQQARARNMQNVGEAPSTARVGFGSQDPGAPQGRDMNWGRVRRVFTDAASAAKAKVTVIATKCAPQQRRPDWEDEEEESLMDDDGTVRPEHAAKRSDVQMAAPYDPASCESDDLESLAMGGGAEGLTRRRRNHDADGL